MKQKKSEKEEEQKKIIDVSLLTNDQLRPWTMDPALEQKLSLQMEDLEQTITFTSPQKNGGKRGDSILDIPSKSHGNLEQTIREKVQNDPIFQQTFERRFEPFTSTLKGMNIWNHGQTPGNMPNNHTTKSNIQRNPSNRGKKSSSQPSESNGSNKGRNGDKLMSGSMGLTLPPVSTVMVPESRSSFNLPASPTAILTPTHTNIDIRTFSGDIGDEMNKDEHSQHHVHFDDDIRYIEKLQKQLRKNTLKGNTLERPSTTGTVSAVHYQPVRSPAVISMRMREYELLKATVDASPSHHRRGQIDSQESLHGGIPGIINHEESNQSTPTSTYQYLKTLKHRPRNHHADRYSHTGGADRIQNMNKSQSSSGLMSPHDGALSISGFAFESSSGLGGGGGKASSLSSLSPMRSSSQPGLAVTSNDKNLMVKTSSQFSPQKQALSPVKSPPRLILSMKPVPQNAH
jgi:hypothetical protein